MLRIQRPRIVLNKPLSLEKVLPFLILLRLVRCFVVIPSKPITATNTKDVGNGMDTGKQWSILLATHPEVDS